MSSNAAYNDSAFLYLLFTAQFFGLTYLTVSFARKAVSKWDRSLLIKVILIVFLSVWFYQVFGLV